MKKKLVLYPSQSVDVTYEVNSRKPSAGDKKSIVEYLKLIKPIQDKQQQIANQSFPKDAPLEVERNFYSTKKVYLELYSGKITFGQANSKILEITKNTSRRLAEIGYQYEKEVTSAYAVKEQKIENERRVRQEQANFERAQRLQEYQQEQQLRLARCQNAIARVQAVCNQQKTTNILNIGGNGMPNDWASAANIGMGPLNNLNCGQARADAEQLCK